MVKADINLPDGKTINIIDGTPKEISSVIEEFQRSGLIKKAKIKKSTSRDSAQQRIRKLINEGFFKDKRTFNDVLEKLEENGHFYKNNQISTPLIRLVSRREIRRFKEDNIWNYVNY